MCAFHIMKPSTWMIARPRTVCSSCQWVSRGISRLRRQRRPFFFTRNGVFWDACWSWLGARPRTALWQTGGNGTHAVRSAVGRAVGRTAHTGGAGLWNRRQAHGVLAVQKAVFRRHPEVTQRDKGVTTQTCFLPRGGRAQDRSVGEGASPFQANLGGFHGRLLRWDGVKGEDLLEKQELRVSR